MPPASPIFHNWRLKLSALGLSVFLWAVVQAEPSNRETFSSVPVQVQVQDTGWTLAGTPEPSTVEVRLGGVAQEIINLAREGTTLRIPVSSIGSRDTTVALRREWVAASDRPGVTVESVTPSTIRLAFEPALSRLVPVASRVQGAVGEGLALAGDVSVNPPFVRIRGPESRVQALDSIPLEPFDLTSVDESGVFSVPVDTSGLAGATAVPATVSLGIRVEEVVERIIPGVPVRAGAPDGAFELILDPDSVQVRLFGARSLVTGLDPARLEVSVGAQFLLGMAPGEVRRVPLQVEGVPERVTAEPLTEQVTVRRPEGPGGDVAEAADDAAGGRR